MKKRLIVVLCMVVVVSMLVPGEVRPTAAKNACPPDGAAGHVSSSPASLTGPTACGNINESNVTQLLLDTTFSNGVKHFKPTNYPYDNYCNFMWTQKVPSLTQAQWNFLEVAENTFFCQNSNNPTQGATLSYASVDNSKQFIDYQNGTVRYVFDSSHEWRNGCKWGEGTLFPHGNWNWSHFLLSQTLAPPVSFDTYNNLVLTAQITLNDIARIANPNDPNNTCNGDWGYTNTIPNPNHALFYIALVLTKQAGDGPTIFYALVPAFNTEDGSTNRNRAPWYDVDPDNKPVYFSPEHPVLTKGVTTNYNIDVQTVAAEALGAYYEQPGNSQLDLANYKLTEVLIGWETWGGYRTDVTVSGLALNAYTYSQHDCSEYYRYFSWPATDHYYTLDNYEKFSTYINEGALGQTPTVALPGTKPLYRYWNASILDHYYTTELYPLPWGGYVYEGLSARVFTSDPGNGYRAIYQYWNASVGDHYYTQDYYPGGFGNPNGYIFEKLVGYLQNP